MRTALKAITGLVAAGLLVTACESFDLEPQSKASVDHDLEQVLTDQEIIVVVNSVDASLQLEREALRRGYRLNSREVLAGLDMVFLNFQSPAGISPTSAWRELEGIAPAATAGAMHLYAVQADTLSEVDETRNYPDQMIAWPQAGCVARVAVGVIDGQIDAGQDVFEGVSIKTASFIGARETAAATEHGTAIAELLVGHDRLKGAQLFNAGVVSEQSGGQVASRVDSMIRAIDWMQANDVKVVNISLAGPYNRVLDRVVQRASSKGMIIIAAVGNNGPESPPRYPAAFSDVIAVTAIDRSTDIYERAVRGAHVDFSAPGVDVFVESSGGRYISGTSIAAPFVSARVASDPELLEKSRVTQIRQGLAKQAVDLGASGHDPIFGAGLVRASKDCVK